mgnify:CR=1 FL=1
MKPGDKVNAGDAVVTIDATEAAPEAAPEAAEERTETTRRMNIAEIAAERVKAEGSATHSA